MIIVRGVMRKGIRSIWSFSSRFKDLLNENLPMQEIKQKLKKRIQDFRSLEKLQWKKQMEEMYEILTKEDKEQLLIVLKNQLSLNNQYQINALLNIENYLANKYQQQKQFNKALQFSKRAISLLAIIKNPDPFWESILRYKYATLLLKNNDVKQAKHQFVISLQLMKEYDKRRESNYFEDNRDHNNIKNLTFAKTNYGLANIELLGQNFESARKYLDQAIKYFIEQKRTQKYQFEHINALFLKSNILQLNQNIQQNQFNLEFFMQIIEDLYKKDKNYADMYFRSILIHALRMKKNNRNAQEKQLIRKFDQQFEKGQQTLTKQNRQTIKIIRNKFDP